MQLGFPLRLLPQRLRVVRRLSIPLPVVCRKGDSISMPEGSSRRSRTKILNACAMLQMLQTSYSPDIGNRCERCRRKKIRCSGAAPCQRCIEHSAPCIFEDLGKKIMVPERHVHISHEELTLTDVKVFAEPHLYRDSLRAGSRRAGRAVASCGSTSLFESRSTRINRDC